MKKAILWALASLLLHACGGGSDGADANPPQSSCSVASQRATLELWMRQHYYWNAELGAPDITAPTLQAYFESMLVKPADRYSFAQSTASFEQQFTTGWRIGYGYTLVWEDRPVGPMRVRTVEHDSPAARAGLRRGDVVVSIDGLPAAQVFGGALPAPGAPGVPRRFVLRDSGGAERTVTVSSGLFSLSPVAVSRTLEAERNGVPVKVGYLAYHQFTGYSAWSLARAMGALAEQGVSEMVLDLRYNGGGSVGTSRDLASMIGGSRTEGSVYARLRFNGTGPEPHLDIPFMSAQDRFTKPIEGLQRLIVLTAEGTASASELLINGLRPFFPVVLIGAPTYGKPYGFMPRSECGTTYNAVNFEAFNSRDEGGFAAGMPVSCAVPDDLGHELGDPQERRLREALAYIATGRCSALQPQSAQLLPSRKAAPPVHGEASPPQMFLDR